MAETNGNGKAGGDGAQALVIPKEYMVGNAGRSLSPHECELVYNIVQRRLDFWKRFSDPRRDIDIETGMPDVWTLDAQYYRRMYDSFSIAARVVEVLPKETFKRPPTVYESEKTGAVTAFEKAWDELGNGLRGNSWNKDEKGNPVWEALRRLDIMSGIGQYGVMLLGIDDGKPLDQPVEGMDETGKRTSKAKPRKLLYLRSFDESLAQITQYEDQETNPRFGQPKMYSITFNDPGVQYGTATGVKIATRNVHWSRVIHVADGCTTSPFLGAPRQRSVIKHILSLMKIYLGSGEGFWKGCFPGLAFETHPQLAGDAQINIPELQAAAERFMNSSQKYIISEGVHAQTIAPTVVDPTPQIEVQLTAVCIRIPCPKRIFMGSERGELSSAQDDETWNEQLIDRQNYHATPNIVIPFVDRCIACGVLPEPGAEGWHCWWPDLKTIGEKEKADVALVKTQAMAAYVGGGLDVLIPPLDYFTRIMEMEDEEAKELVESATEHLKEVNPEGDAIPGRQPPEPVNPLDDEEKAAGIEATRAKAEVDKAKAKAGGFPPRQSNNAEEDFDWIFNASTGHWSKQPRVPAGHPTGGEWTNGSHPAHPKLPSGGGGKAKPPAPFGPNKQPEPELKAFPPSKAKVGLSEGYIEEDDGGGYDGGTAEAFKKYVGGDPQKVASLVGAPDNARIDVFADYSGLVANVDHPDYYAMRTFFEFQGKRGIRNNSFEMNDSAKGKGLGTEIFARQVEAASKEGFDYISTGAIGSKDTSYNGYYTWPRLGYDTSLTDLKGQSNPQALQQAKKQFPEAETLLDVMATKAGREWWKDNGGDVELKFDLTPGSRSLKVLETYRKEKAKTKQVSNAAPARRQKKRGAEEIILDDFEEQALEAAWDALEKELTENAKKGGANCGTGSGGFKPGNSCAKGGSAKLPEAPTFLSSQKGNVEANISAVGQLKALAEAGDLAGLQAHPGTPSPKVQAYKAGLIKAVGAQPAPQSTKPAQTAPAATPVAGGLSGTQAKVAAVTGFSHAEIKTALNASGDKQAGDRRAKIQAAIFEHGLAEPNAVLKIQHDPQKVQAHIESIGKGDVARLQKEYGGSPLHDLRVLNEMEVVNYALGGQAYYYPGERKTQMGTTSVTGDYRHELGHGVHYSMGGGSAAGPVKGNAMTAAVDAEYADAMKRVKANPPPHGIKLTHEQYETQYGVVGKRGLDNEKEHAAEHYRLYHREIYRDKHEGGNGKFLAQYRERHPGWAKIWDSYYTAALLGEIE